MAKKKPGKTQLPLFPPESAWQPPNMADLPSDWNRTDRLVIDVETRDEQVREMGIGVRRPGCYMIGYSVKLKGGPAFYVPFRHENGDNVDETQALSYMRSQIKKFKGEVIGANLSYDLDYLAEEGAVFREVEYFRDIQMADPLLYELHPSFSLKNIGERYGIHAKDETLLREAARSYGVDPKGGLWRLPARYVGAYAEGDVNSPLEIIERQERLIDSRGLRKIYDLESKVLPVLVKMRRRGVLVDVDRMEKIDKWSLDQETKLLQFVKDETSYDVGVGNVWKSEAMAEPLKRLGIEVPKTAQGLDSITKDILDNVNHPVADALKQARKVNKLRTTFVSSVLRYMTGGRIHCTFQQMARETEGGDQKGARYGRLSCTDPNLQQQPSRDEFAKEWRSIYLPEPGKLWCSADYSQQEPRWTTHFASLTKFKRANIRESAIKARDAYRNNPDTDSHAMMAELTGLPRKPAKAVFLGLCYGEGGGKLSEDLGLPTRIAVAFRHEGQRQQEYFETESAAQAWLSENPNVTNVFKWRAAGVEGQKILDQFDNRAPHIKALAKMATERANNKGEVKTILGRQLHFEVDQGGGYKFTHKALNRIIQGSSADQAKQAIVDLDAEGHYLQLQVHDEIAASVDDEKEANQIGDIMNNCVKAEVPFKVDVELGTSWGDSMKDD